MLCLFSNAEAQFCFSSFRGMSCNLEMLKLKCLWMVENVEGEFMHTSIFQGKFGLGCEIEIEIKMEIDVAVNMDVEVGVDISIGRYRLYRNRQGCGYRYDVAMNINVDGDLDRYG